MHIFLNVFFCFVFLSFLALYCQYSVLSAHDMPFGLGLSSHNFSHLAAQKTAERTTSKEAVAEFSTVSLKEVILRRASDALSTERRAQLREEKIKKREEAMRKQKVLERQREDRAKRAMLEDERDVRSRKVRPACEHVEYLINPTHSWCPIYSEQIVLLVVVASAPQNAQKRNLIRQTWGSVRACEDILIIVRFFIGESVDRELVAHEAREHRDIIQQGFHDSYNNLTLKTLGALAWITDYCQVAKYALKTDDDTFINIFNVARFLKTSPSTDSFLCGGTMKTGIVNRVRANKWYVSKEDWPQYLFPPYCHGFGYFLPVKKIPEMLEISCNVPKITVEDAFMGILAYHLNVTHVYPQTEPKKLLRSPSMIVTDHSLFPLALWTSKSSMDRGRFDKMFADFDRYQSTLLFIAHLEDVGSWQQLWSAIQRAK